MQNSVNNHQKNDAKINPKTPKTFTPQSNSGGSDVIKVGMSTDLFLITKLVAAYSSPIGLMMIGI